MAKSAIFVPSSLLNFLSVDHAIVWDDTRAAYCFDKFPELYDDVYMDLTFVKVLLDSMPIDQVGEFFPRSEQ